jgi:hypothetical protein
VAEFAAYPKLGRLARGEMTITEKIDGTNACVVVEDGQIALVQSRKCIILPEGTSPTLRDNAGFAGWVYAHAAKIAEALGEGRHYGEWAGPGIQKNPLDMIEKRFFLFNTNRFPLDRIVHIQRSVAHISVVPTLYTGDFCMDTIHEILRTLVEQGTQVAQAGSGAYGEGVVVSVFGSKFKMTRDDRHKGER